MKSSATVKLLFLIQLYVLTQTMKVDKYQTGDSQTSLLGTDTHSNHDITSSLDQKNIKKEAQKGKSTGTCLIIFPSVYSVFKLILPFYIT